MATSHGPSSHQVVRLSFSSTPSSQGMTMSTPAATPLVLPSLPGPSNNTTTAHWIRISHPPSSSFLLFFLSPSYLSPYPALFQVHLLQLSPNVQDGLLTSPPSERKLHTRAKCRATSENLLYPSKQSIEVMCIEYIVIDIFLNFHH